MSGYYDYDYGFDDGEYYDDHSEGCDDDQDHDDQDHEEDTGETCYGCDRPTATASYLEQRFCWPCYQSVANGQHSPDRLHFSDPGGNSALRAAGPGNPRVHPCPNCREPNRLTPQDRARGYQCDTCADKAERDCD